MRTSIGTEFLSEAFRNRGVLHTYLAGRIPSWEVVNQQLYLGVRDRLRERPDHLIKNHQSLTLGSVQSVYSLLPRILDEVSDSFLRTNLVTSQIEVNPSAAADWQTFISGVSPLLVVSWILFRHLRSPEFPGNIDTISAVVELRAPHVNRSALPPLNHKHLRDWANAYGLYESHMHLNGSTEADTVWADALRRPTEFKKKFFAGKKRRIIKELLEQEDPTLDHEELYRRLSIARNARSFLVHYIKTSQGNVIAPTESSVRLLLGGNASFMGEVAIDVAGIFGIPGRKYTKSSQNWSETLFLILAFHSVFRDLNTPSPVAHVLYEYLLLQCQFLRLLVQQTNQYGFDQFQKIAASEIRESVEEDYRDRFAQLAYSDVPALMLVEGRFAPSSSAPKLLARLGSIISGYRRYKGRRDIFNFNANERMRLKLIAHFIKRPDVELDALLRAGTSAMEKRNWICRHSRLRTELAAANRLLESVISSRRYHGRAIYGFDGASNELDAPPEVFAPTFRRLARLKLANHIPPLLTFHVGEDFVHLVSGIRAVYEAIEFLELGSGHRIGHGTAIGICPALWRSRIGPCVVMKKGDRLDDLVFAFHIIRSSSETFPMGNMEIAIRKLSQEIYGREYAADDLYAAWRLRKLDPILAFDRYDQSFRYSNATDLEFLEEIGRAKASKVVPFEIFRRYHGLNGDYSPLLQSQQLVAVDIRNDFCESELSVEFLLALQRQLLDVVRERNLTIEVLPTSNQRISFYTSIAEHHVFRWLGLTSREAGDRAKISIGSDDPGIFSTNLEIEYSQILQEATRVLGLAGHSEESMAKALDDLLSGVGTAASDWYLKHWRCVDEAQP